MNNVHQHVRRCQTCPLTKSVSRLPLLLLGLAISSPRGVAATPIQGNVVERRDSNSSGQAMPPKIWVPIVVVVIILFFVVIMSWTRKSLRNSVRLFSFAGAAPIGAPLGGATGGAREITAEQLAGTINGENQSAARTTRRARRPRRTPSQMSVTSLPPYNKEPGEEELVIFRGRDMEDATMPAAVVRTSADNDSSISLDQSQVLRYSPMPTSPHNMPLLHNDDTEGDLSMQSLHTPPGENMPRRGSARRSHETSSLMRSDSTNSNPPDPRGEAPAYFEVVGNDSSASVEQPTASPSTSPEPPQAEPPQTIPRRRSGFRTLLNRMSIVGHPQGHSRNASNNSAFSSNMSHGREGSASRASTHRTTPSGSGSLLSASMFRTLSRQRSTHTMNSVRLNSPSLISLNSISSPLTHTVTRTEFTYPKAGPTAEQLKVISSRESFARFGVPYGADAIAFASSSRLDLLPPPPDFDAAEVSSPRSAAGPSRLRSASNAADMLGQVADAASEDSEPEEAASSGNTEGQASQPPSLSPPPTAGKDAEGQTLSATTADSQPAASSSISKNHNSISGPAADVHETAKLATTSTTTGSRSSARSSKQQIISEFGKLSAPASSYHDSTGASSRTESRASMYSNQTFATAVESLRHSSASQSASFSDAGQSESGTEPSTPRLGAQHELQATNATVVPLSSAAKETTAAGQ
ncbi:hypothetical protein BDZ97DRAFT_1923265 [Flammula alnicola]|nr:hypothetical protein BDZ97DRAFT_1923265 [Flammula alnicola]